MCDKQYTNPPPNDIASIIRGACFDYADMDDVVLNETVRDRVYNCWQQLHMLLKQSGNYYIDWVNNNDPDTSLYVD